MTRLTKLRTIAAHALLLCCPLLIAAAALSATAQVLLNRRLYPDVSKARQDINVALVEARRTHKRIILDFGGDWCGDCQVLDIYFRQSPNAELLAKNFIKVPVNIGRMDANIDIAKKYGVPVHGVPALAVLDEHGKVLFAQDREFEDMAKMQSAAVTEFLNKWKR